MVENKTMADAKELAGFEEQLRMMIEFPSHSIGWLDNGLMILMSFGQYAYMSEVQFKILEDSKELFEEMVEVLEIEDEDRMSFFEYWIEDGKEQAK